MTLVQLHTKAEVDAFCDHASCSVILYHMSGSASSEQTKDFLSDFSKEFSAFRFGYVEAEKVSEASFAHKIVAVPTTLFFVRNVEKARINGYRPMDIRETATLYQPSAETDLQIRTVQLINKAPVMLFMKGNPEQPACGFSRQMVQLLKDNNIDFDSFDILTDSAVREALKKHFDWPTYPMLVKEGELIGGLDVVREELKDADFVKSMASKKTNQSEGSLESRLRNLINSNRLMLFMKGDREQPRCGFSRQLIELLNGLQTEYGTFDILEDEEIRQGLKEFSNWPTYPQLYLDGELIGGLDVVREEFQDPDFVSKLPKGKLALEDRLKKLVNSHKLMLFMKGRPDAPQCGFSRKIVELLNGVGADYGSFDIFSDSEVREGLKKFSNWPTYPQLYLNGELVGGLDVVAEEFKDEEFVKSIPKK